MASYYAITPNDNANLPAPCRFIYVGTPGTLMVKGEQAGDTLVQFVGVTQGWLVFPFPIMQVGATGTSCTGLVASP